MKVEIRHIRSATVSGYAAIYIVRLPSGETRNFGIDYRAAHAFVDSGNVARPAGKYYLRYNKQTRRIDRINRFCGLAADSFEPLPVDADAI